MNFITTIINYKIPGPVAKRQTTAERRAERAADGRCQNCGGERPCSRCANRTRAWRKARRG